MNEKEVIDTFLQGLLSPGGAGILLWLIVGAFLKAVPSASQRFRFYFALFMAFVIPPAAVLLRAWLGYQPVTKESMLIAIGVGFLVSQGVHYGTEHIQDAMQSKALDDLSVTTAPLVLTDSGTGHTISIPPTQPGQWESVTLTPLESGTSTAPGIPTVIPEPEPQPPTSEAPPIESITTGV